MSFLAVSGTQEKVPLPALVLHPGESVVRHPRVCCAGSALINQSPSNELVNVGPTPPWMTGTVMNANYFSINN